MVLLERLGAVLDSRLGVADGGVRGREFEPETLLGQSVSTRGTCFSKQRTVS